jgi:hypothetical protein
MEIVFKININLISKCFSPTTCIFSNYLMLIFICFIHECQTFAYVFEIIIYFEINIDLEGTNEKRSSFI